LPNATASAVPSASARVAVSRVYPPFTIKGPGTVRAAPAGPPRPRLFCYVPLPVRWNWAASSCYSAAFRCVSSMLGHPSGVVHLLLMCTGRTNLSGLGNATCRQPWTRRIRLVRTSLVTSGGQMQRFTCWNPGGHRPQRRLEGDIIRQELTRQSSAPQSSSRHAGFRA
jgi:hypothetical protein